MHPPRKSVVIAGERAYEEDDVRIKFIIPFPFDDEGIANRAAQIPREILGPDTDVECVPVRNSATLVDCHYEALVFDMYIVEAGLRAEEEGYDAVVMDTVSDSGLSALRSRLSIPVIGPGPVALKLTEAIVQLGLTHSKVDFPSPSTIIDDRFFSLVGAGAGVG